MKTITEHDAREILRSIAEVAKLARASGACDGSYLAAHNEYHDEYAHDEMQKIRARLGLPPLKRRYHLPER